MASSVVNSAAQQLGKFLAEEAKTLYKVKDKIESLQVEMQWMHSFLKDADTKQDQERVRMWLSQIRDIAYDTEDVIEKYVHKVSQHRQDGVMKTLKWFSCILCTSDAWTLHNLGSDIDDLKTKISELTSRLQTYGIQSISPTRNNTISEERRTYSYSKEDVVGFEAAINEVVGQLVNANVSVVGISGIGGLGKTTLARKVFNHPKIRDRYTFNDNRVWIYISKEFNSESIFQEIFYSLEKENILKERKHKDGNEDGQNNETFNRLEKENILKERKNGDGNEDGPNNGRRGLLKGDQLVGEIHKQLQLKKCLIVLDDIWTVDSWKRLEPAFESIRGTSSKILLTTRTQNLMQHVVLPHYLHIQQHLSFDDSWKLLQRKAFNTQGIDEVDSSSYGQQEIDPNEPQDGKQVSSKATMEKIRREMLKHCNGLPIAIVALGGILSTKKTLDEWEKVQKNISSYLLGNTGQERGTSSPVLKVLELSFQELPFYLKPCFLYLGYFPEDYEISTQRLYQLWKAEGLLVSEDDEQREGETSYDIGEIYLNELVQRSMVGVEECWGSGKIKTCKLHDVMRDMCLRKCAEVGFLNHMQCTTNASETATSTMPILSSNLMKLRRCAMHDHLEGDVIDRQFDQVGKASTGLRSLLLFGPKDSEKILPKNWSLFPLLRVLSIEVGYEGGDIGGARHLIHLRYLSLRYTNVRSLSWVYGLKYLETLDLRVRGYRTVSLRNMFHKMKSLRHLYLPADYEVKGGGKLSFPVRQMETLKSFDPTRCEMGELMQMENLRIFSIIKWHTFESKGEVESVLSAPVMKNPGRLINSFNLSIAVDVCNELETSLLCALARHPSFNKLKIEGWRYGMTARLMRGSSLYGDNLKQVDLICCKIGEEDISALGKLPHLKSLTIDKDIDVVAGAACKKVSFSVGSFPELTTLEIVDQAQVEEWEVQEGALAALQSLKFGTKNKVAKWKNLPSSLTKVEVKCVEIREEGGGLLVALEELPLLQQLQIQTESSNEIRFSGGSFPNLTQLRLQYSNEIEEVGFGGDGAFSHLQTLDLFYCTKLKQLKNLPHLQTFVFVFSIRCEFSFTEGFLISSVEMLPHLQQLVLFDTFLTKSNEGCMMALSPGSFSQLRELRIVAASELEEWEVGDGALPNLQRLELYRCKRLKKIPDSLPATVHIECGYPCIPGIEKYNTCPHFKPAANPSNPMAWLRYTTDRFHHHS